MAERVVLAFVDEARGVVKFVGPRRPKLKPPMTFVVEAGDTVTWRLFDAKGRPLQLGAAKLRIRFLSSPAGRGKHQPLLDGGKGARDVLDARNGVISASVIRKARGGSYLYHLELVQRGKTLTLGCVCASSADDPGVGVSMAGGHKSPPPPP
jgi:hypothetical protein